MGTGGPPLSRLESASEGPGAAFFFLLGFASLGFPGTLSFVGEYLLLHGVLEAHPLIALPMLLCPGHPGHGTLRGALRPFPASAQLAMLGNDFQAEWLYDVSRRYASGP